MCRRTSRHASGFHGKLNRPRRGPGGPARARSRRRSRHPAGAQRHGLRQAGPLGLWHRAAGSWGGVRVLWAFCQDSLAAAGPRRRSDRV